MWKIGMLIKISWGRKCGFLYITVKKQLLLTPNEEICYNKVNGPISTNYLRPLMERFLLLHWVHWASCLTKVQAFHRQTWTHASSHHINPCPPALGWGLTSAHFLLVRERSGRQWVAELLYPDNVLLSTCMWGTPERVQVTPGSCSWGAVLALVFSSFVSSVSTLQAASSRGIHFLVLHHINEICYIELLLRQENLGWKTWVLQPTQTCSKWHDTG